MSDIECPYCGAEQEINHDDGYGYEESVKHQQECAECGKTFIYETSISFDYWPALAPCLNGQDHEYKPTITFPRQRTKMRCIHCDETRACTREEKDALGYWKDGDFVL